MAHEEDAPKLTWNQYLDDVIRHLSAAEKHHVYLAVGLSRTSFQRWRNGENLPEAAHIPPLLGALAPEPRARLLELMLDDPRTRALLPDASFDVIHVQQPLLPYYRWAGFLEECFRLLRPGGMFCLVAWEQPMTNAPAWERFSHLTLTALTRAGYSRSHGERHAGLLCDLEPLCYTAGFRHSVLSARWINFSYVTPLHKEWAHPLLHASAARCLILQADLATREELNILCRRQRMEMQIPNFHAVLPLLVLWCTRAA